MDFLSYSSHQSSFQRRYMLNFNSLKVFCIFVIMSVDGQKRWAYNAAHRTRAAALLAADELALGFP